MSGRTLIFSDMSPREKERRIQCTANMRTVCYALSEDLPEPLKGRFEDLRPEAHRQLVKMYRRLGHGLLWVAPQLAVTPNYYIRPINEVEGIEIIGDADVLASETMDRLVPDHIRHMQLLNERNGEVVTEPQGEDVWKRRIQVTFGYDLVFAVPVHSEGVRGVVKNGLFEGVVRRKNSKRRRAASDLAPDDDLVEITLGRITKADVNLTSNKGAIWFTVAETGEPVKIEFPLDKMQNEREKEIERRLNDMFVDDIGSE